MSLPRYLHFGRSDREQICIALIKIHELTEQQTVIDLVEVKEQSTLIKDENLPGDSRDKISYTIRPHPPKSMAMHVHM